MDDGSDIHGTAKLATEIVVAYLNNRTVEPEQLPSLVREIRAALDSDDRSIGKTTEAGASVVANDGEDFTGSAAGTRPVPAVPVENSVHPEYIVSLEDGRRFRSLTRHLKSKYGMTPEDYRRRWGLASDYPMVAENYRAQRSDLAKKHGLGRRHREAASPPPHKAKRG